MKSTLLIVLVIGIVGIIGVGLLITIDYLQNFEYPHDDLSDLITDDDKSEPIKITVCRGGVSQEEWDKCMNSLGKNIKIENEN